MKKNNNSNYDNEKNKYAEKVHNAPPFFSLQKLHMLKGPDREGNVLLINDFDRIACRNRLIGFGIPIGALELDFSLQARLDGPCDNGFLAEVRIKAFPFRLIGGTTDVKQALEPFAQDNEKQHR